MMKIGIIVAMEAELNLLLNELSDVRCESAGRQQFHLGRLGATDVVVMQCGIGKVNAAVGTAALIHRFGPDAVVNTGVAGGTGRGTDPLSVVVADEVAYHDVWCGEPNARGQVQGLPARFACDLSFFNPMALKQIPNLHRGLIASGDYFVQTPEELARVKAAQPDAVAVDMESAAIAQVCHLSGIPFAVVRVVSDTPGVENHSQQYANFWSLAPQRTFAVVKALLAAN